MNKEKIYLFPWEQDKAPRSYHSMIRKAFNCKTFECAVYNDGSGFIRNSNKMVHVMPRILPRAQEEAIKISMQQADIYLRYNGYVFIKDDEVSRFEKLKLLL